MESELINHIDKQIDVHVKFMDSIEQIRWRFTSAFGITALAGLLFINGKAGLEGFKIFEAAAYFIVLVVSIAGLITQIRIIGLFWSQWKRIRGLQLEKLSLLEKNEIIISDRIKSLWSLPYIIPKENQDGFYFTVHESNSLLFSMLISVSIALIVNMLCQNVYLAGAIAIIGTGLLTYLSHIAGKEYCKQILGHT
ncbi:MAG: hypothetical protein IPN42_01890 [Methylococcaceae bacterium]|nr:hypothetical protein [Methylococcaceae bacterium]